MGRVAASFKHLTLFILEFDLVEAADLAPLKVLTTFLPLSYHFLTTFLPLSYNFLTTFLPLSYHILTTFLPPSYHLLRAWCDA
jgi:hypothetical protein